MDLKLCPACGQSVLDDDASVCPFCGSAMDGSDKGSRKPPAGKSATARPAGAAAAGTRKPTDGAARTAKSGADGAGKSESKPVTQGVQSARGGKPKVDEDDPFGLGTLKPAAGVIQALAKPEKGHLHRVICPMCEKPGFVAKSAIGKQVRCANEKCMVPVFTVPDPDAPAADPLARRKQATAAAEAADVGSAKPRSPLVFYSILGVVLLVLAVGLVQFLNRGPTVNPDLTRPVAIPDGGYGGDPEATDTSTADIQDQAKKTEQKDPSADAERLVKRMIQLARLNANRDKAFARRLTADVYLRLNQPAMAAQEFSQLLLINRQAAYYQIEPRLRIYWQKKVAGDTAGAKSELEQMLKDAATIPGIGRIALESAMGLASVLIVEGRLEDAVSLIGRHQRDATVILNRDAMSSAAWFFTGAAARATKQPALAVTDVFAWSDPLRTAVAADLAARSRGSEAITWAKHSSGRNAIADSLSVIAELSAHGGASSALLKDIESAAAAVHPMVALRVQAVIAAEQKSVEKLQSLAPTLAGVQPKTALTIPAIDQVLRMELPDSGGQRLTAAALTEYVRAAVICGDAAAAEEGIRKLTATMFEYAPPTAATRQAVLEVEQREADVKRRISTDMRITRDTEIATTFRNYRRKVDQMALAAEERRLSLMQKLARIVRAGGVDPLRTVLNDAAAGLKQEVMVDELAGLLAAAATRTGNSLPEVEKLDPALKVQLPERTRELHEIAVGPLMVTAWHLTKQGNLPAALKTLSAGSSDLPGLREAVVSEIVDYAATRSEKPDMVYAGIGQIGAYPVWREEALQLAGRIFAQRGLEKAAEKWVEAQSRMPATEQVTALYGLALGLIDKASSVSAPDASKSKKQ